MILDCVLTCPHCGYEKKEEMSPAGGQESFVCVKCAKTILPKPEDCCVFCSWGSLICPPMQERRNTCCDYPA